MPCVCPGHPRFDDNLLRVAVSGRVGCGTLMSAPFLFLVPMLRAGVLLVVALLSTGCATRPPPATPPPHAFINYDAPKPGDTRLRFAVKDLIDMKGEVTTAGSQHLYLHGEPATKDAECLRIARASNVNFVGKTNLSEFAVGVTGSNEYFGTPVNPIDPARVPGGSSSGSAVAVAMDLADVALGTDTGGSIRVPAACCGIMGLKTTFGLISIKGVHPLSPTYLDTVGPMARDIARLVEGMKLLERGFGGRYAKARAAKPTASAIRIGRLHIPGTDPAIERAIDRMLAEKGFQVKVLDADFLKEWRQAQRDGNLVAAAASWYNNGILKRETGVARRSRTTLRFGNIVYRRRFSDEERRDLAVARRDHFRSTLNEVFADVDAIALPVLRRTPPRLSTFLPVLFEAKFLRLQNTVAVNYAGVPALAMPVPLPDAEFPVTSVQFVGPPHSEAQLLNIGRIVEGK